MAQFERDVNAENRDIQHEQAMERMEAQANLSEQAKENDRQRLLETEGELVEVRYTAKQKMELESLQNQLDSIRQMPNLTEYEKFNAEQQIKEKISGIKPGTLPRQNDFPKEWENGKPFSLPEYPGDIWQLDPETNSIKLLKSTKESTQAARTWKDMSLKDRANVYSDMVKSLTTEETSMGKTIKKLPSHEQVMKAIREMEGDVQEQSEEEKPKTMQKIIDGNSVTLTWNSKTKRWEA